MGNIIEAVKSVVYGSFLFAQEGERIINPNSSGGVKNPKICIVYLASPRKDTHFAGFMGMEKESSKMHVFLESLKSAKEYLPKYQVIVFHEDFTEGDMKASVKALGRKIKFVKVNFSTYKGKKSLNEWIKSSPKAIEGRPAGYRMMCRFFCGVMQNHPALKGFDYYIRMDHDSFFNEPKNLDIEECIGKYNFDYMYRSTFRDKKEINAMWEFTKKYANQHNLSLEGFRKLKLLDSSGNYNGICPYNNFHVAKLKFWKRKEVKNYLAAIEKEDGIILKHWQDANIHALLLGLFSPVVLEKTDFGYHHNSHFSIQNSLRIRFVNGKVLD